MLNFITKLNKIEKNPWFIKQRTTSLMQEFYLFLRVTITWFLVITVNKQSSSGHKKEEAWGFTETINNPN